MKKFRPQIRTRNYTADPLRGNLGEFDMRAIVRLGSRTSIAEAYPKMIPGRPVIEINTAESCHNSGDKILMKQCFDAAGVKTARWANMSVVESANLWDHGYPAIIKHKNSCKGNGIYFIESEDNLQDFLINNNRINHIIEEYKGFQKEYRLHITEDGCFYTCRKMLKSDATDRWHRHDSNSVWILEDNPLFEKPKNWDDIVAECVKALNAVGLTIGACDVKVQSEKGRGEGFIPDFIILEINSAASLGSITLEKYKEELPKIINKKISQYGRSN